MKKKLISSIVCFGLLVVMFVGSSIAWFTDSASSVNTMVAGKISIEQTEKGKVGDTLEDFVNNKYVMLPNTSIFKQVTVENTGNQPAYVRTLFAFEDSIALIDDDAEKTVVNYIEANCVKDVEITIPGVTNAEPKVQFQVVNGETTTTFTVGYYVLPVELEVDTSFISLEEIYLKSEADNAWLEAIGSHYEIIVLSQGAQVTGLGDVASVALDTAFAPVNAENCSKVATWFEYVLKNTDGYGENITVIPYPVPAGEDTPANP